MYKKLILPVALSDPDDSAAATKAAQALADAGAEIVFLHVIEELPAQAVTYLPEHYLTEMRQARQEELTARAAGLPGARAEVVSGSPANAILEYAEATGADCIIMASHRPGLRDWLIGSTAARVVRHARCAVLVLR